MGNHVHLLVQVGENALSRIMQNLAFRTCICEEYETSVDEFGQPSRNRRLSEARGIICWLATRTGAATLTEVSKMFHRDVGTMSHVVRRIDLAARREPEFTTKLEGYNAILQA